jgi:anaerobic selenocysteine-containing dehydrogenase
MNRLYFVESTPSLTGAMADHRISSDPKGIADLLRGIRIALDPDKSNPSPGQDKFISALVGDLRQSAGKSLVAAGPHEAPAVQEFAHWCNELLGNVNVTVDYFAPDVGRHDLGELINEINAGSVETLVIIGGNPVYDAPADLEFARALAKVSNSIHIDLYANETAEHCRWHIPEAHALESWSDACAFDGTATIMQPVIEPLFAGRSRHQLLAALLEEAPADSYEIVRGFWGKQLPPADFEKIWRKSLHDGIVANWRATGFLHCPDDTARAPFAGLRQNQYAPGSLFHLSGSGIQPRSISRCDSFRASSPVRFHCSAGLPGGFVFLPSVSPRLENGPNTCKNGAAWIRAHMDHYPVPDFYRNILLGR